MTASGCDDSAAGVAGWQHAGSCRLSMPGRGCIKVARDIAVSTCHRRRRAGPSDVPLDENTVPPGGGGLDRMVDAVLTASALHSLSADHREVIVELFYRGRPVAEVATLLGIPEGTVRSRCSYALRVLREVVEEQGIAGSCAQARVSRHLVACRGCRADYDELVPVRARLSRPAPAATLTSRSAGAMPAVRDWSDQ